MASLLVWDGFFRVDRNEALSTPSLGFIWWPVISAMVAKISVWQVSLSVLVFGFIFVGHFMMNGTRFPPS